MKKGFSTTVAVLLASTGLVSAQSYSHHPSVTKKSGGNHAKPAVVTQAVEEDVVSASIDGDWTPASAQEGASREKNRQPAAQTNKGEPAAMPKSVDSGVGKPLSPYASQGCCNDGCDAGYSTGHWVNVDYLLWWTQRRSLPPLITSGNPASQGILGQPGTQLLFGGSVVPDEPERSGIRVMAGTWLGCDQSCGIEIGAFYFPERDERNVFGSDLSSFLARPFFSLNESTESSEITSQTGLSRGFTTVHTPLEFWGAEINGIHKLCCGCAYRVDFLAGARYLDLDETVQIDEWIRVEDPLPPEFSEFDRFAGATITVQDRFFTRNQFYGGQIGLDSAYAYGPWQVGVRGKLGIGVTRQTIDITGNQSILYPTGIVENFNGGLLALASNIGRYHNNEFSVVPEVGVNVGYRVTDSVLIYTGYTFLYWSRVVRAGDQIDRVIDVTQIPNFAPPGVAPTDIARPAVPFAQTDFWAQGLNFGVEFCW